MDFSKFKRAVAKQFDRMQGHALFTTDVDKDALWELYLSSFLAGTNLEYRKRTEHDCSGCRNFIKKAGHLVAIINGKLETVWDNMGKLDPSYNAVAEALSGFVKAASIQNVFLTSDRSAGVDKNFEKMLERTQTWEHFFINVPSRYIAPGESIGPKLSETRALHDVLLRSLQEIDIDSTETVLELIAQNSLYRGAEHKFVLETFLNLQNEFKKVKGAERDLFVWSRISTVPASVSKIRNTSIGTLLVDLAGGKALEDAVRAFEAMVAPANYKRPTALVTKAMVERAKKTIDELGLTSALERRYATNADITVNNILFADRGTRKVDVDVFDEISGETKERRSFKKVEEVSIDKFLAEILPRANSVEVFFENKHTPNLVSLIAPVDPTAAKLFKWGNNFSWSYNGDMADSIKERVKAAGGNVSGELCCRLAWDYTDDLDFHLQEPNSRGRLIYYGNRRQRSSYGGMLDVDANGADGLRDNPVENIFYEKLDTMGEGLYELKVHNFTRRSSGAGFEVEIDIKGVVRKIVYDKVVKDKEMVPVAILEYSKKEGLKIVESLPTTEATKKVWGISTQNFHKVKAIMHSPNFWDDGKVGNKHYLFMLEGCANDGQARGFFNEFLREDLNQHRKVIEIVGSKMKTEESNEQLSGLGFSSTQRNELLCQVTGAFKRVVKVVF